jgi:replication-associated recombination protein RarA
MLVERILFRAHTQNKSKMLDNIIYDPHAPKCVDDIIGNGETWKKLASAIAADKASHIVLVGPPGCGKSLFLRFALADHKKLLIECTANAGLRDVRNSIHIFACGKKNPGSHLRWVIFEHADMLSADTQAFLRRMLETTSETTRFLFECRNVGAISEPILSRASIVNISSPNITEILYEIKRRTGFSISNSDADTIAALSFGNMRSTILNTLAFKQSGIDNYKQILDEILLSRPQENSIECMVAWGIHAEETCRNNGIDLRDVLRLGWPLNPIVNNTCATWSRLGGTSPRTLFFDALYQIVCDLAVV